jgi:hypothetical protein
MATFLTLFVVTLQIKGGKMVVAEPNTFILVTEIIACSLFVLSGIHASYKTIRGKVD